MISAARRSFAWGATVATLLLAFARAMGYVGQVAFARWMGTKQFGVYVYALSWTTLLTLPAQLGFGTAAQRLVPEFITGGRTDLLGGFLHVTRRLVTAAAVGIAVVAALITPRVVPSPEMRHALWIAFGIVPCAALLELQKEIMRGTRRVGRAFLARYAIQPPLTIVLVYMALKYSRGAPAVLGLCAAMAAHLVTFAIQELTFRNTFRNVAKLVRRRYETKAWLRLAFPLLAASGFVMALQQTDILMVGMLAGPRSVGIYSAADRTASLTSFLLGPVNAIAAPMIASAHAAGNKAELDTVVSVATRWTVVPAVVATVAVVVFGSSILGLFGSEFRHGYGVLVLLALGELANAAAGPVGYVLALTGHERTLAVVYGTVAIVNVALQAIAIPLFGILGAAAAAAAATAGWNFWMYVLVRRRLRRQ